MFLYDTQLDNAVIKSKHFKIKISRRENIKGFFWKPYVKLTYYLTRTLNTLPLGNSFFKSGSGFQYPQSLPISKLVLSSIIDYYFFQHN